jgi:hypothetical protein
LNQFCLLNGLILNTKKIKDLQSLSYHFETIIKQTFNKIEFYLKTYPEVRNKIIIKLEAKNSYLENFISLLGI